MYLLLLEVSESSVSTAWYGRGGGAEKCAEELKQLGDGACFWDSEILFIDLSIKQSASFQRRYLGTGVAMALTFAGRKKE